MKHHLQLLNSKIFLQLLAIVKNPNAEKATVNVTLKVWSVLLCVNVKIVKINNIIAMMILMIKIKIKISSLLINKILK
jgi:hypothetical protein